MAKIILSKTETVTDPKNIIRNFVGHLNFQRDSGTEDVIVQSINNKKDPSVESNWRNIAQILDSDTYKQQVAFFASRGYWYRAKIDGNTNTDTEVSYSESVDAYRRNTSGDIS